MTNYLNKLQQWLTTARWEQFKTDERIQKLTEEQKQKVAKRILDSYSSTRAEKCKN
jgi:hypothetical protein